MNSSFEVIKPNLAAIQTAFTGRLYTWDMFTLYRAVSGRYTTYPSVLGAAGGISLQQDFITFIGALGPAGRFHYIGDIYSAIYNDMVERDLRSSVASDEFWQAWTAYTRLLREDAAEVGEPLRFPALNYELPKLELDIGSLSGDDRFIYAIYQGDVDSMEVLLSLMSRYMPESLITTPLFFQDLKGIFQLYADWAAERFLGSKATSGARIMSKVILLADYRWYLLAGDLLSMIEPLRSPGFSRGINELGTKMRLEAERIQL